MTMSADDYWNILKYAIQSILKKMNCGMSFEDLYR